MHGSWLVPMSDLSDLSDKSGTKQYQSPNRLGPFGPLGPLRERVPRIRATIYFPAEHGKVQGKYVRGSKPIRLAL